MKNIPYTREVDSNGKVINLSKENPFVNKYPSERGKSFNARFVNNRGKVASLLVFPKAKYRRFLQLVNGKTIEHLALC